MNAFTFYAAIVGAVLIAAVVAGLALYATLLGRRKND